MTEPKGGGLVVGGWFALFPLVFFSAEEWTPSSSKKVWSLPHLTYVFLPACGYPTAILKLNSIWETPQQSKKSRLLIFFARPFFVDFHFLHFLSYFFSPPPACPACPGTQQDRELPSGCGAREPVITLEIRSFFYFIFSSLIISYFATLPQRFSSYCLRLRLALCLCARMCVLPCLFIPYHTMIICPVLICKRYFSSRFAMFPSHANTTDSPEPCLSFLKNISQVSRINTRSFSTALKSG